MLKLYERADSPYWYAEFVVGEIVLRKSTGVAKGRTTRRQAEEAATKLVEKFEIRVVQENSISLAQAWALFSAANPNELRPSTIDQYEDKITRIIAVVGDLPISTLTAERQQQLIKELRGKMTDIKIRQALSTISSILEYAIDEELPGAPKVNPRKLLRTKHLKSYKCIPRWASVEQIQKLMDARTGVWVALLPLLLETGMRVNEALGLTWDDVDLSRKIVRIGADRAKNHQGRVVPLSSTALKALAEVPRRAGVPWVFISKKTGERLTRVDQTWGRMRKKAGVPKRIHDLRHTFASWTRQLGMSRDDRKDIAGHTTEDAHDIYSYPSIESLVESMEKHSPSTLLAQR